jgi:hypothetical protein
MANTLSHHLQAAYRLLSRLVPRPFSIYDRDAPSPKLLPFLADRIAQRRKWQKPREKREPYTLAMLHTLHGMVLTATSLDVRANLGLHALVFDVIRLGLFTGSRVGEYAQTKGPSATIHRIPSSHADPAERGKPVAFVASDFVFLDTQGRLQPPSAFWLRPELAAELRIQFRHDKSGRNFTTRRFGPGKQWLCPIRAALSLLCRAKFLRIPANDPICAYTAPSDPSHTFLRDRDVTRTMRQICVATYPDPCHVLRTRLSCFVSHSNRVTAAVALQKAGLSIDAIAFRLRWQPASVSHYLRECTDDADAFTTAAIHGAMRT